MERVHRTTPERSCVARRCDVASDACCAALHVAAHTRRAGRTRSTVKRFSICYEKRTPACACRRARVARAWSLLQIESARHEYRMRRAPGTTHDALELGILSSISQIYARARARAADLGSLGRVVHTGRNGPSRCAPRGCKAPDPAWPEASTQVQGGAVGARRPAMPRHATLGACASREKHSVARARSAPLQPTEPASAATLSPCTSSGAGPTQAPEGRASDQ